MRASSLPARVEWRFRNEIEGDEANQPSAGALSLNEGEGQGWGFNSQRPEASKDLPERDAPDTHGRDARATIGIGRLATITSAGSGIRRC